MMTMTIAFQPERQELSAVERKIRHGLPQLRLPQSCSDHYVQVFCCALKAFATDCHWSNWRLLATPRDFR